MHDDVCVLYVQLPQLYSMTMSHTNTFFMHVHVNVKH